VPGNPDLCLVRNSGSSAGESECTYDASGSPTRKQDLFFGLTMFRHPMEEKVFKVVGPDGTLTDRDMTNQRPFDFESVHIFKIQKGQIHDIEAMGISLPLRSKNGWSEFWR
jgi:hypothetical protein